MRALPGPNHASAVIDFERLSNKATALLNTGFQRRTRRKLPACLEKASAGFFPWNQACGIRVGVRQRFRRLLMGRALLLWIIGIPIPIILLVWLLGGFH
jgi:hypothetical protein